MGDILSGGEEGGGGGGGEQPELPSSASFAIKQFSGPLLLLSCYSSKKKAPFSSLSSCSLTCNAVSGWASRLAAADLPALEVLSLPLLPLDVRPREDCPCWGGGGGGGG